MLRRKPAVERDIVMNSVSDIKNSIEQDNVLELCKRHRSMTGIFCQPRGKQKEQILGLINSVGASDVCCCKNIY